MSSALDLQNLLVISGVILIAIALFLLVKQLFKLLLIVLVLVVLLYAGYRYAEANHLFAQTPEVQKIEKAVERATELGAEALRKGKELKAVVDTLSFKGDASKPQNLTSDSLQKGSADQGEKKAAP